MTVTPPNLAQARPTPWLETGWMDAATTWIQRQIAAAGVGPVLGIAPEKVSARSAVYRVQTAGARLFFKAGPLHTSHEPALTAWLAKHAPAHIARVVAVDTGRCWMLTHDVRGRSLADTSDIDHWRRAVAALARMQRDCAACADDLFEAGCRDRSLPWLARHLTDLVDGGLPPGLTADEQRRIECALPRWSELAADATLAGVPDVTLDHADLHPRNVVVTAAGPVFLDWEGAALGHPFTSLAILLGYMEHLLPALAPARAALRDAYLAPWTACAPMPALVEAFERHRPLASLKYAVGLSRLLAVRAQFDSAEDVAGTRAAILQCLRTALNESLL